MKLTIRSKPQNTFDILSIARGAYFRVHAQGTGYLRTESGAVSLDHGISYTTDAFRGKSLVLLTDVEITATDND